MNKILLTLTLTGALLITGGLYKSLQTQTNDSPDLSTFTLWKNHHSKTYQSQSEESYRLSIFNSNLATINSHNSKNLSWTMAVNIFADLTNEEFSAQYKGFNQSKSTKTNNKTFTPTNLTSIDWTTKGAVTAVKNQGQCGSCWAFSATGGMEGGYFLKTGKLISLSEQQLVACSKTSGGNAGCGGGLPELAFTYAQDKGMETEASYPYRGMWYLSCGYSASKVIEDFNVVGFSTVEKANSDSLKDAVAASPVSIGIDAQGGFQFYSGGVMNNGSCGTQLDHGVLIVGFGSDNGQDFWKVKNSWGGSWGETGYFRIARKSGAGVGMCGLTEDATVPNF